MKESLTLFWTKFKSGIFQLLSANTLNKIITMLSTMVITRILTKYDYGIWSYVLNIYSYLIMIAGLGLSAGAFQYGAENVGNSEEFSFYKYCLKRGTQINIAIVIISSAVFMTIALSLPDAKVYLIAYMPFLLLQYCLDVLFTILRCQNRIKEYAKLLNINTILTALGICLGAFAGVYGIIIGKYIAIFISLLSVSRRLTNEINLTKKANQLSPISIKRLWKYSLFTGASSAMNTMVYLLDVTMVANLLKDAILVGNYKVGSLIPNALQFIPSSIIIAILPNIIYHKNDYKWIKSTIIKTYGAIIAVNLVLTVLVVIFAKHIILVVSGEQYMDAVPVLKVLMIGYFFSGSFRSLSTNVLAVFHRVKYGLFISVSSCVCDILFNMLLIQKYGMMGAAYATLGVDIVTAVLSCSYLVYLLLSRKIQNTVE